MAIRYVLWGFSAECGQQTACRRNRAVARPVVSSRVALRHRLLRSENRNPDSALWEEPSSGRWSTVHRSPTSAVRFKNHRFLAFGDAATSDFPRVAYGAALRFLSVMTHSIQTVNDSMGATQTLNLTGFPAGLLPGHTREDRAYAMLVTSATVSPAAFRCAGSRPPG